MIKLDRLDPDWKFAKNHGKANKAGYDTTSPSIGSSAKIPTSKMLCKCCLYPIQKEEIPLWEHSKQLQVLGFGFPLFYQFLKNCILLLFLSIASYNAMSLRQAVENNYELCHNTDSTVDIPHRMLGSVAKCYSIFVEMARIQHSVSYEEEILRIVSFVVHMIGLLYVRNRIVKLDKYYNERTPTFVDFSIIIKRLPKVKGIQKTLHQFFRKQFSQTLEILHLTLLPQYPEIQQLEEEKKKIINKLRPFYDSKQEDIDSEQAIELKKQLLAVEQKIHDAALESNQIYEKDELICEKAICIFNLHREKNIILKEFPKISKEIKQAYFGQKNADKVYILQAPQPTEIHWQNVNLPKKVRVARIFLSYLLSILTLVGIFVVIFFILQQKALNLIHALQLFEKSNSAGGPQYRQAIALVYVAMFLIVIFNKTILSILFHKFTDLQRHTTTSKFQFSFEFKLSIGFFFTTALMTLAVQAIRFNNYYAHPYGVIDEESIMFFINSFFIPLFWFVNPFRIAKFIKRKLKYGKRSLTQREANQLMEDMPYDMGKRFAEIIETMWFTFLYSTLTPVGAIITIFGLIVYYWVDKYNLLRRSSINRQISGKLIQSSLNLLDLTLFFKPIGSVIFDKQLRNQSLASTIVMICIGAIYVILPKNKLIKFFDNEKFRQHQLTYKDLKKFPILTQTYNTEHPVIRIVHDEKIKTKLSQRGIQISQTEMGDNMDFLQASPSNLLVKNSSRTISTGRNLYTKQEAQSPAKTSKNISTQTLIRQQNIQMQI